MRDLIQPIRIGLKKALGIYQFILDVSEACLYCVRKDHFSFENEKYYAGGKKNRDCRTYQNCFSFDTEQTLYFKVKRFFPA